MFVSNTAVVPGVSVGYQIERSLRFRASATAYLNRTVTVAGDRRKWTWSGWAKLGAIQPTNGSMLFSAENSVGNFTGLAFTSTGGISLFNSISGTGGSSFDTAALYRDASAWYHVVLAVDTAQVLVADRAKLYINGQLQVWGVNGSTAWNQNVDTWVNANVVHSHGRLTLLAGQSFLDGYLTEVVHVDGQALTPSSFGQTDSVTGQWSSKAYTGAYGTNGFYLPFSDNSALTAGSNAGLGKDFSGNGNYWNTNNLSLTAGATYDSMIDVPLGYGTTTKGNFCTLDPLQSNITYANSWSEGNLQVSGTYGISFSTVIPPTGKWYAEFTPVAIGAQAIQAGFDGSNLTGYRYQNDGLKYINGTVSAYGASYATGDVIGIAVDLTGANGSVTFYKNGVSQGALSFTYGNDMKYVTSGSGSTGTNTMRANFGQRPFAYTPPTGFLPLHSGNLTAPSVLKPTDHFTPKLRTGTGAAYSVSGLPFSPGLVWAKSRSAVADHLLFDSLRGVQKYLSSNSIAAEGTSVATLTSFDGGGYSGGADTVLNGSGGSYVDWMWKSASSAGTNTNGTILSQVMANPTAGFSVVTYTGTGVAGTIGHGLGVAPALVIVKNRNVGSPYNWAVWHKNLTSAAYYLTLNATTAQALDTTVWNSAAPTSSVFSVGTNLTLNGSGFLQVAYCFAEIAGYSKMASYVGNGSVNGPFVYCGFRPAYILVKSSTGILNWDVLDTQRDTKNVAGGHLTPNSTAAEVSSPEVDLLSNGFKLRTAGNTLNGNGATYVFMAFAESPFKYALAR